MTQRYYVIKVAYNNVAEAEDRPQPLAFDDYDSALKAYHSFMQQSILAETTGWVFCIICDRYGTLMLTDRWESVETTSVEE